MLPHTPSSQYIYDLPDIPPLALVNMAYHKIPPVSPYLSDVLVILSEGAMWNFVTEFVQSDLATEQYIIGIKERYDSLIVMSNVQKTSGGLIGHDHILSLLVSHEKKSKDVIVSLRIGDEDAFVVGIKMVDSEEETTTFVYAGAVHEIFVAALNSAWNSLQVVMNNIIDKASRLTGPDALDRIQVTKIVNYIFADVCSLPGIKRVDALLNEA
ncbi:hypothetical protein LTS13_003785 [Exophiala xenobiotica]|nr:hypothetical protein LTR40_006076 [Exophiala xenobiotica]KAK5378893.1 hypothetical protein LTS13_003785 [Exophiala xenobiotica]KAK5395354.1 hypothetical protein LTR79_007068 [Exophiala xenobiotica]KAK5407488.1 hypothetical protein LTR90_010071 [Exophiala xenobiotica]